MLTDSATPPKAPAIFFDCDGVLNEEPGGDGVLHPDDVRLIAGAGAAVKAARDAGFITVAITNRAQVAKGLIGFTELDRILERLQTLLGNDGGALDRIYFCPHYPDRTPAGIPELQIHCDCRKPGKLLFERAIAELEIDRARSVAIGDSLRDIAAAHAVGVRAYGVRTGNGCRDSARNPGGESAAPKPDEMFDNVREAVAFHLSRDRQSKAHSETRPSPPRLLYVVTEDWYFLSHRLAMARAARAAGFEVHVATNVADGATAISTEGFRLHPVPFARGRLSPIDTFKTVAALRRVHRAIRPDIVHRVAVQPTVLDAVATVGISTASVNAITGFGHTFIAGTPKARVLRALIGAVLRLLVDRGRSRVLVQNPDDRAALESLGILSHRIALIPGSGVDVTRLRPMPEPPGPVTMAFVGRLLDDKGIRTLIAAHRLLRNKNVTVDLLIAGTPDPANPATVSAAEAESWAREPGITWLGHVPDISIVWARAHLAVLPSRREGLPKCLLEAAACGRPMIATDVPGCREVVIAGETGLLVPVDDAAALAAAIERLASTSELRTRLGRNARRLAETRFSEDTIGQAAVRLYLSLVAPAD